MSLLIARSACAAIRCGADGGSSQACGVLGPRATHPQSPTPIPIAPLAHPVGALQTGGTRKGENHLAFETLLTSIIPDDSDGHGLITFLSELLDVDRKAIRRCIARSRSTFGYHGFVSVLHLPRAVRCTSIVYGRLVAREFWHAMCRLDTRPGKCSTGCPIAPVPQCPIAPSLPMRTLP